MFVSTASAALLRLNVACARLPYQEPRTSVRFIVQTTRRNTTYEVGNDGRDTQES